MSHYLHQTSRTEDYGDPGWLVLLRGAFYALAYLWLIGEAVVGLNWWSIPLVVLLSGLSAASAAAGVSDWKGRKRPGVQTPSTQLSCIR